MILMQRVVNRNDIVYTSASVAQVQKESVKANIAEAMKAAAMFPTYISLYLLKRYKNMWKRSIMLIPPAIADREFISIVATFTLPNERTEIILPRS